LEPQASMVSPRRSARREWVFDPRAALTRRLAERIAVGRLIVTTPSGERIVAEGAPGEEASLHIHRWRALTRVLFESDIGFAKAVIDGDVSSPDLVALLRLFDRNVVALGVAATNYGPARLWQRIAHARRANTRSGSSRNILDHYDLGNAFFSCWLDPSMNYSSGVYASEDDTLETAQARKMDRIAELLGLAGGERVLEIGCGWGSLARRLLDAGAGALDAVTLSPSQAERARAVLTGKNADVRIQDYRELTGAYDRVVSIEMCEAVGEAYLPVYFQTLSRSLRAGGRAVIQAITISDGRFGSYRETADFIQRFVFPGGFLPSDALMRECFEKAGLRLLGAETFGHSYALTLAEWRRRFHANWGKIAALGFDARFRRLWDYYLCYCEAGFRERTIDVGLYTLEPI
jgi:cyclopropane-fatty-acyl-phospholipid synthase